MQDQPKNTPGPWVRDVSHGADWGWVRDVEGRMVAVCGIPEGEDSLKHRRNGTDPTEANARLIAAAPDLLEALKKCVHIIGSSADSPENLWRTDDEVNEAYNSALAAIAKAEGRGE